MSEPAKKPKLRRSWITKLPGKREFQPPTIKIPDGFYTLELGITPRITYTRPAIGIERHPIYDPTQPACYDTVTYFLNPFLTWTDQNQIRTGKCSCKGYQTRKQCKHLIAAQELALPFKHLLELTTCTSD